MWACFSPHSGTKNMTHSGEISLCSLIDFIVFFSDKTKWSKSNAGGLWGRSVSPEWERENSKHNFATLWIIQSHPRLLSIDVPTDPPKAQLTIMTLTTPIRPQSSLFYYADVSALIFIPGNQSRLCCITTWYSAPDVVKHRGEWLEYPA